MLKNTCPCVCLLYQNMIFKAEVVHLCVSRVPADVHLETQQIIKDECVVELKDCLYSERGKEPKSFFN